MMLEDALELAATDIHAVQFRDGFVEISYQEPGDANDRIGMMRTVFFRTEEGGVQVDVVLDLLRDLLDDILVKMRNPPDTRPGRMIRRDGV